MFILCNCDLAAPPPPLFGSAGALPSCFADDEILTSSVIFSNLFNSFSASTLCMSYKSI